MKGYLSYVVYAIVSYISYLIVIGILDLICKIGFFGLFIYLSSGGSISLNERTLTRALELTARLTGGLTGKLYALFA